MIENVIGVISIIILVCLFGGFFWLGREKRRIWATGTDAERFEDQIDEVVARWRAMELDTQLVDHLATDLRSFCADAIQGGSGAEDVFGQDLDEFAESWARAHRLTPDPVLTAALRFLELFAGVVLLGSATEVFRSLTNRTSDDTIWGNLLFGTGNLSSLRSSRVTHRIEPVRFRPVHVRARPDQRAVGFWPPAQ